MVSIIIVQTVDQFIDYALIVVMLLTAYYVVKFFFVEPPTAEERKQELQEQREAIQGHLEERKRKKQADEDTRKRAAEASARKRLLGPAKGYLIRVEESCSRLGEGLRKSTENGRHAAEREIDSMEHNLRAARRIFQAALRKSKGEPREFIRGLYEYIEAMEERVTQKIQRNFPKSLADSWGTKAPAVLRNGQDLRTECGYVITAIGHFIEADALAAPRRVARGPRPSPHI